MSQGIHIFGASGSGTSTLGQALAQKIHGKHLDTDSFYWKQTDPPFTTKRAPADRVAMILSEFQQNENWTLSGSICSWGDPLLPHFSLAVFLVLDPAVRMARLKEREALRYGDRIQAGGDMHQQHLEFLNWAKSYDSAQPPVRSLALHRSWLQKLHCPVLELDAALSVEELCDRVCQSAGDT